MANPDQALEKFCTLASGKVLNVGDTLTSAHTQAMLNAGLDVDSVNLHGKCTYLEDFHGNIYNEYDCLWASHVLEHSPNPNIFLKTCYDNLKDGGLLCITVPPLKHSIVGGHVTLWNAGLLLYNLIIAGFDCSDAMVKTYGYNISVIVKKRPIVNMPELSYDKGDIEKLSDYFPFPAAQGFDGKIENINWS